LVDVLQPDGLHLEWQLVAPALATWLARHDPATAHRRRQVWLVQPPHAPGVAALQAVGLPAAALCQVQTPLLADRLWALEQVLGCPDVAAVLAWLPALPMRALRRLAHAASRHGGLCWLFRPTRVQGQPTPAVLQLGLSLPVPPARSQAVVVDPAHAVCAVPQVQVLKRQGPPLALAVPLTTRADRLAAALSGARWRQAQRRRAPWVAPPGIGAGLVLDRSHDDLLAQPAVPA
jgi:protein ImuA